MPTDDRYSKLLNSFKKGLVNSIIEGMNELSDEERMEVMSHYCKGCGKNIDETPCYCLNDE